MYESDDKMVSHPSHYISESGLESIDVIAAFTSKLSGIEATDTGNIIKYILRWKEKNGVQDLEKIMWYTQHLIDHLKKEDNEKLTTINGNLITDRNIASMYPHGAINVTNKIINEKESK